MDPRRVSSGKEREGVMAVIFLHDDWQHDGTCGDCRSIQRAATYFPGQRRLCVMDRGRLQHTDDCADDSIGVENKYRTQTVMFLKFSCHVSDVKVILIG